MDNSLLADTRPARRPLG